MSVQAVRPASLDVLKDQLAPNATDDELRYLGAVAQRLGLDPIAGHIVLIPRWDSRLGRDVHRPQVTADGRLVLADRTGELEGFDGPEWCGPRNPDGSHTWLDVWEGDDPPHAARVFVYRAGRRPANGTVRWSEFAQRDRQGRLTGLWAKMESHMLGKVALSLGMRRAFPGIVPIDADLDDDLADIERRPEPDEVVARPARPARAAKPRPASPADRATLREWYDNCPPPTRHRILAAAKAENLPTVDKATVADRDRLAWLILSNLPESRRPEASATAWIAPDRAEALAAAGGDYAEQLPADIHDDLDTPEALDHEQTRYDPADDDPGRPFGND